MSYTTRFGDAINEQVSLVGGKGARLSTLYGLGFPVPKGRIVTILAYRYLLEHNDLTQRIRAKLVDEDSIEAKSATIREWLLSAAMPDELAREIESGYTGIGSEFVAVRSSSTLEDGAQFSFAGQHASMLNVRGAQSSVRATQEVMASLFNAGAMHYSAFKRIDHSNLCMAAILQRMVDSQKAGVMFTIDPVTFNRSVIVIEAAFGLGESVVSGAISPDRYYLDKKTGAVTRKKVASKKWGYFRDGGRTVRRVVPWGDTPTLSDLEAKDLADYGMKIEEVFGQPQDIEWAIDTEGIKILQARPVDIRRAE